MTPLPTHFDAGRVAEIFRVPYLELAAEARRYRETHGITKASTDTVRVGLLLIDVQNTFSIPGFELFVAGRSGMAAVHDSERLCRFIYHNVGALTRIHATLDTHTAMQIFHSVFLVDRDGHHPPPMTEVTLADVETGRWRVNPDVEEALGVGQDHLEHYCRSLTREGKFSLMVWPYHAMLGGVGHALVSSVEEALFFHNIARSSQTAFELKGDHPATENYSVFRPEVEDDIAGRPLRPMNGGLVDTLLSYDALVISGQAKSHCVSWTVLDLLAQIRARDETLAERIYLLEDCTSPVVVPGVVDFTDQADRQFKELEACGMHLVRSSEPIESWPAFPVPALARERR